MWHKKDQEDNVMQHGILDFYKLHTKLRQLTVQWNVDWTHSLDAETNKSQPTCRNHDDEKVMHKPYN
jgi:hypothetical protein